MLIEWAVATRPCRGEQVSGDLHVVEAFPDGALVGVIDGLGHGEDAATTAELAAATLRTHAHQPVPTLIRLCHLELRSVRGAVMTLASFNGRDATISCAGIGNVEGYLIRSHPTVQSRRETLLLRNGVVGLQIPEVRTTVLSVAPGDLLILATDGVAGGFVDQCGRGAPQQLADDILSRYGKQTDDALVLVVAYVGTAS